MGFYYATEKRKFDLEWEKTRKWYRECGMSEESINEMYLFDLKLFNRQRAICAREIEYNFTENEYEESMADYNLRTQVCGKAIYRDTYYWDDTEEIQIEEISNSQLRRCILNQDETTQMIIRYLSRGFSYTEIGHMLGQKRQSICDKIDVIRKYMKLEIY